MMPDDSSDILLEEAEIQPTFPDRVTDRIHLDFAGRLADFPRI